ncbi:MAG: LytTR family DNA-binding domain-containing protein [Gammaproteobacteria bacterium]|nr:LytTR family DNA-binding domain-containing protein [Gammaproteobacteria bacterium]
MKVLVADDEPLARERLRALLEEIAEVGTVLEAADGRSALDLVMAEHPDVVLLDIRMPGMDGLEAARHMAALESPPPVVFTTAYEQHALDAFEVRAVDYLLKPIGRERLAQALTRAHSLGPALLAVLEERRRGGRSHISAPSRQGLSIVPVDEVRFLLADNKYVTVGWPGGELLTEEPLKAFAEEFGERFIRIHRAALVAGAHVRALERTRDGRHEVAMTGVERRLEVSRRLLPEVRRRLRGG